ncbi:uncharacterized protein TRIADDRAFT_28315, partial [Trichoplax adhaerens]
NRPLQPMKMKWTAPTPMTDKQLKQKRQEFWETAPVYEGRREIWNALQAATQTDDLQLAQAIIDSANVILPTGSLASAYDELGNHYVLPEYCLSEPTNLISNNGSDEEDSNHLIPEKQDQNIDDIDDKFKFSIKLRLSSSKEEKLRVHNSQTILQAKRHLCDIIGVEPHQQRWYFYGRKLEDKMKIEDSKLSNGYVVQVVTDGIQPPTPVA